MKNKMKEAMGQMTRETLPDDFGLLPGTFVRPLEKNLPSLFNDFKQRWLMEKTWLKNWGMGVMRLVYSPFEPNSTFCMDTRLTERAFFWI